MSNFKMLNNDSGVSGIYRAKLIKDNSNIRVYVPCIHSMNPFNEDGTLKEDCKNNIKMFPLAQWCCYLPNQIVEEIKDDKIYWVMFENGDFKRPVVINYDKETDRQIENSSSSNIISTSDAGNTAGLIPKNISLNTNGLIYPLACKYTENPFSDGREFGAARDDGRYHAGIDLIVPDGTEIYAMQDCEIMEINIGFYQDTNAVIVRNKDNTWYNYGECIQEVEEGNIVTQGTCIAKVKAHSGGSMLHFEAYAGDRDGTIFVSSNSSDYDYVTAKLYKRRGDLCNPSFVVGLYKEE